MENYYSPYFDNFTFVSLAIFVDPLCLDMPSRIVYKMLISIEILVLIGLIIFVSLTIGIAFRSVLFHPNFRSMITFLLAHSYIYIPCRIRLILHQERVFAVDLKDGADLMEIMLIISSILRVYHGLNVLFLYCAVVIERVLATRYMHDYELKRRFYISIILRIAVVFMSLFFALELSFVFLELTYRFYLALIAFCGSISAVTSVYLYFYNRHRLKHVLKRTDSYSLSLRYQLIENMRAFRFLQTITAVGVAGITVNCLIVAVPQFILEERTNAMELCGASFETLYALTYLSGIILCFLSQPVWKREFRMQMRDSYLWKRLACPKFEDSAALVRRNVTDETNVYFDDLVKNWDLQLKKTKK